MSCGYSRYVNRLLNHAQVFRNDSPPPPVHPPNTASAIIDGGGEQIISYWQRTTSRKSLFRDDTSGTGSISDRKPAREEFVIWGITAGDRWGRELYRFSERLSEKDSDKLRIGGLYYYAHLELEGGFKVELRYEFRSTSLTHDYIFPENLYF